MLKYYIYLFKIQGSYRKIMKMKMKISEEFITSFRHFTSILQTVFYLPIIFI